MRHFSAPSPLARRVSRGIACHVCGEGAPLVLIHGVGLSADCWLHQLPALSRHYRVFALDLPGHGQSEMLATATPTLDDFADKIADFLAAEITDGVAGVAVAGHSLGALLTLALALRHARLVRRAAALSAVHERDDAAAQAVQDRAEQLLHGDDSTRAALIEATLARWFGAAPAHEEATAADCCRHWLHGTAPAAYAAAYRLFANNSARQLPLEQLTQPVLYLTGDADANSTADMSRQMAARTPSANAVIIPKHAHMVQMTAAERVNEALLRWMGEDSDGSSEAGEAA